MTKKQARRQAPRHRAPATRQETDHQLAALLSYISGHSDEHYEAMTAIARRVLTEPFDEALNNSAFSLVTQAALLNYSQSDSGSTQALALRQILSYGQEDLTVTDTTPLFDVLVRCVNDAALVGAILMYLVLKGGAR